MSYWHQMTTKIKVTIPANLSHTGKTIKTIKPIDNPIVDIVYALEQQGIIMRGSCCGHEDRDGEIQLNDGRLLIIKFKKTEGKL